MLFYNSESVKLNRSWFYMVGFMWLVLCSWFYVVGFVGLLLFGCFCCLVCRVGFVKLALCCGVYLFGFVCFACLVSFVMRLI